MFIAGARIKELRKKTGMQQGELAEKLDIDQSTLSRMEKATDLAP